ncbi:hypothetical protein OESDEN_01774 [Oesophagostomum dentatum]|uniref:Uncharacterized protein n=1 Tax=Oesophagostomum dentatum TaxID=61180 RepID=A0A0B1TQ69_OESDE|nr:hypothetical protein OESDEN_01774 [Oesophagostomum dentatum]
MVEDATNLLDEIHGTLASKAPEGISLLEKFISVLEADLNLPASARQSFTEKYVAGILDVSDVEARSIEVYRMEEIIEGKSRYIVFYPVVHRA